MNVLYVGIDPGITGAYTVVDRIGRYVRHSALPSRERATGKGREIDGAALFGELCEILEGGRSVHVFMELVNAMPARATSPGGQSRRMGATSAFNFGRSDGIVTGVLAVLPVSVRRIRPQAWKAAHGLIKKPKDAARTLANDMIGSSPPVFYRKLDLAAAEAYLMAVYGLRQEGDGLLAHLL